MPGQCIAPSALPSWFPAAVSYGIVVASAIIIFIAYCIRERQLRRTFYGIMDEMEENEKQQQDEAEALAGFDGEVRVIQSMEKLGPHCSSPIPRSQVKVMMKRRSVCSSKPRSASMVKTPISPHLEGDFKYTIEVDRNHFATDIIEPLKQFIIEEVYRARKMNPQEKQLLSEDETKIGEVIVEAMRAQLEFLTNNNPWICHGRLMNNTNWVVQGHENLLSAHTDLVMSVRINVEQPIAIILIGYCDRLHLSDLTLHPTELTASKLSKSQLSSSALKKIKTAEPLINATQTPVTKLQQTIGTAEPVRSPGRPGTTIIPKKSETKKPAASTPKQQLPTTPKRSPPKQTTAPIIPTLAPTQSSTPAPTPVKLKTTTTTTTPKARTPKTTTGISHTPTPITQATTTGLATPVITKTSSAPKHFHGKKTKSDDTQLSNEQHRK
uniref:Uncharacterized protein n=1 Tax=Panagrolaimus sp. PS1159 TaxID=55785 RepID=A0AC35GQ42_9BILA